MATRIFTPAQRAAQLQARRVADARALLNMPATPRIKWLAATAQAMASTRLQLEWNGRSS